MAEIEASVVGLPDLKRELSAVPAKLRVRALRNALAAGARLVRDAARRSTPIISAGAFAVRRGVRKPGTVRDAIVVRTSKAARRAGDVGVFVNVRPAKGAAFKTSTRSMLGVKVRHRMQVRTSQRGANSPKDPYYWRFLNFGTKFMGGARFLEAGGRQLQAALQVFISKLPAIVEKLNKRQTP
jgi:HK97 gp10 family phage protein